MERLPPLLKLINDFPEAVTEFWGCLPVRESPEGELVLATCPERLAVEVVEEERPRIEQLLGRSVVLLEMDNQEWHDLERMIFGARRRAAYEQMCEGILQIVERGDLSPALFHELVDRLAEGLLLLCVNEDARLRFTRGEGGTWAQLRGRPVAEDAWEMEVRREGRWFAGRVLSDVLMAPLVEALAQPHEILGRNVRGRRDPVTWHGASQFWIEVERL